MSEYGDPLGFERKIEEVTQLHILNPITEDLAADWNSHPVTIRLKQYLQIDLYDRLKSTVKPIDSETLALYVFVINYPVLEQSND